MGEETIRTDVDRLVELLKIKKKMDLRQLVKELKIPEDTIQEWVDFLVEEKILAIDYDLTKPIVSIVEQKDDSPEEELEKYKLKLQKEKQKNPSFNWKNHVLENVELMRQFFYTEAEKRDLTNIDDLWEDYKKKVSEL